MPYSRKRIGVVLGPVLAAVFSMLMDAAAAQERPPHDVRPPSEACFLFVFCALPSAPGANWALYDRSGTLGRQGLGASPFHPEGPGNVSY